MRPHYETQFKTVPENHKLYLCLLNFTIVILIIIDFKYPTTDSAGYVQIEIHSDSNNMEVSFTLT